AQVVDVLLHAVADVDERADRPFRRLGTHVAQHLADLRVAAGAVHPRHQRGQRVRVRNPARGAALARAAEIDELNVEPACRLHGAEHVGLEGQRHVPRRLSAHGGVHGEDEASAPHGRGGAELLHAADEIGDVGIARDAGRCLLTCLRRHLARCSPGRARCAGRCRPCPGFALVVAHRATSGTRSAASLSRTRVAIAGKDGASGACRHCAMGGPDPPSMNFLLLALVPACFALNPVIGRAMADAFGPASLSVVRWLLSALVIAALALVRGGSERWSAPRRHWLRLGTLGAMAMGFCSYAALVAAHTTEATNIALVYGCASAFVAAWEIAAGRQRLTLWLLLGVAACLGGVVLVITRGHPDVVRHLRFAQGDLWATAGMGVFVIYTVAMRRAAPTLTPLAQFTVMSLAATLALAPFAVAEVAAGGLPAVHGKALAWIAALVLGTGIGAFLGYNAALTRNGPVLTSASLTLTPVFAAGMAMALVGERLAWYHAAG